jgi:ubiquinone biosynthesis accessory factor UbiJ
MIQTLLNSAASLINQALQFNPKAKGYLAKLEGASIQITIENISVFLLVDAQALLLSTTYPFEPNTIIRGPILAFVTLMKSKSPRKAANLGLSIAGDLDIGESLQNLFLDLNLDWEEWLAGWLGDNYAYKIGDMVRTTHHKGQEVVQQLAKSTGEYMQKAHLLPTPEETQGFLNQVDNLRMSVDRLEARLQRLEA